MMISAVKKLFTRYFPFLNKRSGPERRRSVRVPFEEPLPCQITDPESHKAREGWIKDISAGGLRVITPADLAENTVAQVGFYDEVTKQLITVYVRPLQVHTRETIGGRGVYVIREYRCPLDLSHQVPGEFESYYRRTLSDYFVTAMSHQRRSENQGQYVSPSPQIKGEMVFKIAETVEEREAAYRLVYHEYLKRRFVSPNEEKMFTYPFLLLPGTTTFIGLLEGEVVMTLTAVLDSPLQLPMQKLFGDVLEPVRKNGRTMVEFGMLAVKKELFGRRAHSLQHFKKMSLLFSLFRVVAQYCMRVQGATDIVIAIPPRYQQLYQYLCFESLTQLRYYGNYHTSALAMRLDLIKVTNVDFMKDVGRVCLMKYFFKQQNLVDQLRSSLLTNQEINILFRQKSKLMSHIKEAELKIMGEHFPQLHETIRAEQARREGTMQAG